ncbi:hypothetical protein SEVIR_9G144332v4 [Setaria viridis]
MTKAQHNSGQKLWWSSSIIVFLYYVASNDGTTRATFHHEQDGLSRSYGSLVLSHVVLDPLPRPSCNYPHTSKAGGHQSRAQSRNSITTCLFALVTLGQAGTDQLHNHDERLAHLTTSH